MKSLSVVALLVGVAAVCLPFAWGGVVAVDGHSSSLRSSSVLSDKDAAVAAIVPDYMRVEYLVSPVGLSTKTPRFGWALKAATSTAKSEDQFQTSYEIKVLKGDETVWSPGVVSSASTGPIPYAGPPLDSHTRYSWTVRVYDTNKLASPWSDKETFVTGVLEDSWGASWIERPSTAEDTKTDRFRKKFDVAASEIREAYVSTIGLGQFEMEINGVKVTSERMTPGWTNYKKTCLYTTFDVTNLIQAGTGNAVGITVASGMYNVPQPPNGRYTKFVGSQGTRKLIFLLTIVGVDGKKSSLVSDGSWQTAESPVTFSHTYAGEDYDATLDRPDWSSAQGSDDGWSAAALAEAPTCALVGAYHPPITIANTFVAGSNPVEPQPGQYVYDVKENVAGWPVVKVSGPARSIVRITTGELLDPTFGNVTQLSEGGPVYFQFTLRGEGTEEWHPVFMYHGFRYIQLEFPGSKPGSVAVKEVSAHKVHSSSLLVGSFETSDPDLNAVHKIILRAIESNMQSIFTDCPHREKLGWLEELNLQQTALTMNYDVAALFSKVVKDMEESQTDDGLVPDISPEYTVFADGFRDSPEWGSTTIFVAHTLYMLYGNVGVLSSHYASMDKYMDYLTSKADRGTLQWGLMDWISLADSQMGVTATAYYYLNAKLMAEIAGAIGNNEGQVKYTALTAAVKKAFNDRFYDANTMTYGTGNQTDMAIPLVLGFVDNSDVAGHIMKTILDDITQKHGGGTTCGEIGYGYLIRALSTSAEHREIFYKMAMVRDKPSYMYNLLQGATTLTETWNADPTGSWNHFMLAHIEDWYYGVLAGISLQTLQQGTIILAPRTVPGITFVNASHMSSVGLIRSEWFVDEDGSTTKFLFEVPPNLKATISLPCSPHNGEGEYTSQVGPGTHTLVCPGNAK